MAEMSRARPDLDIVMNEGIAFLIDQFKDRLPETPVSQLPVMIGRRKRDYDTLDKVMTRLDVIHYVMEAMDHIILDVDVH